MDVQVGNAQIFDATVADGLKLLNDTSTENENSRNNWASCENSILDDMDSYMEDLNARLIVSRMVSDSVIRGMVTAIDQDCAEKLSLKEHKMENPRKDLLNVDAEDLYVSGFSVRENVINHAKCLDKLRIAVEERIRKLKEEIGNGTRKNSSQEDALDVEKSRIKFRAIDGCIHSLESLLAKMHTFVGAIISSSRRMNSEQQFEKNTQLDNCTALLQSLMTDLHHEYKSLLCDLKHKWDRSFEELDTLRCTLDDISKSLFSWEDGFILPHDSLEVLEERNALKRKDQPHRKQIGNVAAFHDESTPCLMEKNEVYEKPTNGESPQLMCKTKEELIGYFKTEMAKMKRQHDAALQEKTEELFSLKREFLKEKGSSHLNFKKDKEFELMKKRIAETAAKMDDILFEHKNLGLILNREGICTLKDKIDAIVVENQRLASHLVAKNEENIMIFSKALETTDQRTDLCIGADLEDQIEKLQTDMEALKFEASVKDLINANALRELPSQLGFLADEMNMETMMEQYIYSFIIKESVKDNFYSMNDIVVERYKEKDFALQNLLEKEKALLSEVEEKEKFQQQLEVSSKLLKMTEKRTAGLESALVHFSEQYRLRCQEYSMLKENSIKQELVIVETKKEYELAKFRLEENIHIIHQYEAVVDNLSKRLETVSVALQDSEKQNDILQSKLLEDQANISLANIKLKEQTKQIELMLTLIFGLLKFLDGWEHKVSNAVKHNESRLKILSCQHGELLQQASLLRSKMLCYKQVFELRCDDLQKAETEVDLLGDDVDYLLSLLSKIYMALEHYSSVLKYYPGVMEILKLIRREIGVAESKPLQQV